MVPKRFFRVLRYATTILSVVVAVAILGLWVRSYWWYHYVVWRYSQTGEFSLTSLDGALGLEVDNARMGNSPMGWDYSQSPRDETGTSRLPASKAGFGWRFNSLRKSTRIYIRDWVMVALAALVAVACWRGWRFRLRTALVVFTILAVMLGISARSQQIDWRTRNVHWRTRNGEPVFEVEYDWGPFSDSFPAISKAAFERGTEWELYSLHPFYELYSLNPSHFGRTAPDYFHDWLVLGKTPVNDIQSRKKLLAAFNAGIKQAEKMEDWTECFEPRHGLRVKLDGQTVDFVIDFECGQEYTYVDGTRKEGFVTSPSPQPEFNKVLTAAGVELAPSLAEWAW